MTAGERDALLIRDLFGDEPSPERRDDIDIRVEQFLNRWEWRGDRDVVRKELLALLALGDARPRRGEGQEDEVDDAI